jgi:hypothetical protein
MKGGRARLVKWTRGHTRVQAGRAAPRTIRDGHDERAHVIGNNAVRHVPQPQVRVPQLAGVERGARLGLDRREDGTEHVRVVVRADVLQLIKMM